MVSIQLPVGRDCAEAGAICTANDGQSDRGSGGARALHQRRDAQSNTLTASFENVPAEHDGENTFTFEVAFSEDVAVGYETMRDDAFSVKGGAVTRARRAGGSYDRWEISVEPEGQDAVQITLQGNRECGSTGAVCTRGNDPQPLGNSSSATVAGPPTAPLTASFSDMPTEHAGDSFTFALTFSEDFGLGYRTLRDNALSVTGGTVRKARRQTAGNSQAWNIEVSRTATAQ